MNKPFVPIEENLGGELQGFIINVNKAKPLGV
jgi:hypothetical protein